MALYIYITKECEADAKRHSRYDEMLRLKERVESAQRISHFDNFPVPYLKKRFDRQIRLLADYRTMRAGGEDHVLVCFLRIFVRSSNEYKRFLADTNNFGEQFLSPLAPEEDLQQFLEDKLREHPVPPKDKPSEPENHFLYRFLGTDPNRGAEEFVCESERWVRSLADERIQPMLLHLFEGLVELIGDTTGNTVRRIRNVNVLYRWFPNLEKLFLAGIAMEPAQLDELRRVYEPLFGSAPEDVSEEMLLQYSTRIYPGILLAGNEMLWIGIQKDYESNLALSPEETKVLESVHSNEGGFPIFINGRAGSGKSTLLYYLFTDYVNLYLELTPPDPPIRAPLLLSCSEELRRRAQQSVEDLILHNPRWAEENLSPAKVPARCFQEFRRFLLDHLTDEGRAKSFPEDKYISYATFRRMWQTHFGRDKRTKDIGADVSWHVIRTFIKGMDSEGYLDAQEYEHVPRRQKSVSLDAFTAVYDSVFEGWYKDMCEQAGYWDDQDLARYVFDQDLLHPVYPAVFCDESQDFTRVELGLIFRLCLFTDRELSHSDLPRVPFAFAGDPFQTLNPTGFRWDAAQALFHENLVDSLGKNIYRNIDLNYHDLRYNYRSTKNVVRLCNLIQALRAALFDFPDLQPQITWQMEEDSPMPVWFDRNKPQDWQQLSNEKDVMLIIPSMLNEEREYVQGDNLLSEVVQIDDQGVPVNVLSPTRAKGLEFARVALYGFAEKIPGDLIALLDEDELDPDTLLPFEYFVNQLYVAASRPKRRLFIIESQAGRDRLWRIATDDTLQAKLWRRFSGNKDLWTHSIGGFIVGNVTSWSEDRGNPEENAESFRQQGLANQDPYLLRSAAALYESLGKTTLAQVCKGHALNFENKPKEAGDYFREVGETDLALECYWNAGMAAKRSILEMHERFPDIGGKIEYRMMAIYENPSMNAILALFEELVSRAKEDGNFARRLASEKTFESICREYAKEVCVCDTSPEETRRFVVQATRLNEFGLSLPADCLADLHYRIGEIDAAIESWDKTENPSAAPNYRKAKAAKLASLFEEGIEPSLSASEGKKLYEFSLEDGRYLVAVKCARRTGNSEHLLGVLEKTPAGFGDWQQLVLEVAQGLVEKGEWKTLLDLANMSLASGTKSMKKPLARIAKAKEREIRNAVVATCARSEEFAKLTTSMLKDYAGYLKTVLSTPLKWKSDLTVHAAGAVIERTGRQVDALEFYETIIPENGFRRKDVEYSVKRWIVNKEKQAKRESKEGNERMAMRHDSEAQDKRRSNDLMGVELQDDPTVEGVWVPKPTKSKAEPPKSSSEELSSDETLSDIAGTAVEEELPVTEEMRPDTQTPSANESVPKSFTRIDCGALTCDFRNETSRVNITHKASMNTACIVSNPAVFRSSDVVITHENDRFVCKAWDCECTFSEEGTNLVATLAFPKLGFSLQFSLTSGE